MDAVFHALGDATRRQILAHLAGGERTVSQLAEPFAMSLAAASKHIKTLDNAGRAGLGAFCRSDPSLRALDFFDFGCVAKNSFFFRRLDEVAALKQQPDKHTRRRGYREANPGFSPEPSKRRARSQRNPRPANRGARNREKIYDRILQRRLRLWQASL